MKYGKDSTTKFIDDNGSTEMIEMNYHDGDVVKPVRHRREIRHATNGNELLLMNEILKTMLGDSARHDCAIRIERSKGGNVHVVECYTTLDY